MSKASNCTHPRAVPVEMALCPLTVQFWAADLIAEFSAALARAEAAEADAIDQARLVGMGSEREARLMAERDAAQSALERCKTVNAATAEGWRETQAELDEALAKLARYETLRPASEHDGETRVYWHMRNGRGEWSAVGPYVSATGTHFTPLPDVKEATK